jgi:uncharacterized protein (TIGR03067 family)
MTLDRPAEPATGRRPAFHKGEDMRLANAVFALAVVGFIAADEPKKDDATALKGNWTAVSIKIAGQEAAADDIKNFKLSFDVKTYTNIIGDKVVEEGGFTIDPSRTPKTIDFDIKKGPEEGKKQLGLYMIDGDKLTMVVAQPGATERPKSLKPEASDQVSEVVFQRTKD